MDNSYIPTDGFWIVIAILTLLFVVGWCYYLPYRVYKRASPHYHTEFFLLNTLLGGTGIGWVALLAFAINTGNTRRN